MNLIFFKKKCSFGRHITEPFSLKMYIGSAKTYDSCMFVCFAFMYALLSCLHTCMHHLISNVHIVRTFENSIPFQTFEKWHNVSYRYVSYIKSETCDIWRTGAWFFWGKPYLPPSKPNSTVKTRTAYRGCNACYQVFLENGKIDFKSKMWNFNINFQT